MGISRIVKLVLVLVLVIASTTGEPLTGENVCHRMENYNATWREPYEESVQVLKSTWCLSVPPKCLEPQTEIRRHWREKTEVRTRNVTECCEGYTQQKFSIDDKNNSIVKCVIVPQCLPGFIGKYCDKECSEGSWGIGCREACNCRGSKLCNPITGSCQCPPGWTGTNCLEKCQVGKWGPGCESDCSCSKKKGIICHHVTGNCIEFIELMEKESGTSDGVTTEFYEVSSSSSSPSPSTTISTLSTGRIPVDTTPSKKPESHDEAKDPLDTTRSQDSEIAENSSNVITTTIINNHDEQINPDVKVIKVSKSTTRPILTLVHLSGQTEDKMIVSPVTEEKNSGHTVPLSLDIVAIIVIGSIMSLSLTAVVVIALYHMRTKLFESIRLSIYDAEKLSNEATLTRQKFNDEIKFQSLGRNSRISPSDYETPRCIFPDRSLTLPRTISTMSTLTRESTYSNQFPNIQLFNSPRELLEAHYDRPPATNTFRQLAVPGNNEGEHLYDEIPLQSTMLRKFHQTFQ